MNVALLSGVVRNRKLAHVGASFLPADDVKPSPTSAGTPADPSSSTPPINQGILRHLATIYQAFTAFTSLTRNFKLRVHKFTFQWDLVSYFSLAIFSLFPFIFTGRRFYAVLPLIVWGFYNILFLIGVQRVNALIPGFRKFKHTFQASIEEFFSPKLLPIMSISFLLVALSLAVTGRRLGGPPLCYSSCSTCLSLWDSSIKYDPTIPTEMEVRIGCGYLNGKEMLGYYTMAQTSFLQFMAVIMAMSVCLAWRVAEEEIVERKQAVEWLKTENIHAFEMREEILKRFGSPGSAIRPEGNAVWVTFGIVVAITFTLLGWHNWSVLPPSPTATLLIILNLLTILTSTLILHLGFFGRLLSLYKRNFQRVEYLTTCLNSLQEQRIDAWWNCRSFVLNDDLALDYDIGGLAVSATFIVNLLVFLTVIIQTSREGFQAIMEPPGSYCAYACLYITLCLLKIFTLATNTFEEQFRHLNGLQKISLGLQQRNNFGSFANFDSIEDHQDDETFRGSNEDLGLNVEDDIMEPPTNDQRYNKMPSTSIDVPTEEPIQINPAGLAAEDSASNTPLSLTTIQAMNENQHQHVVQVNLNSPKSLAGRQNVSFAALTSGGETLAMSTGVNVKYSSVKSLSLGNMDSTRQTVADMISQIRKYDPYPCILGIPIMPALFNTSKFYIFIAFVLIGCRVFLSIFRQFG